MIVAPTSIVENLQFLSIVLDLCVQQFAINSIGTKFVIVS